MSTSVISASGILSLLDEDEPLLKTHALKSLNEHVDSLWSEMASAIVKIESLCDDEDFKDQSLAAVVASKVFYHLEEMDEALKYALQAGNLFNLDEESEYVQTMVSKCIEEYIKLRVHAFEKNDHVKGTEFASDAELKLDQDLVNIIERMFSTCFSKFNFKEALGIAVESRRLDMVKKAILKSSDISGMLKYTFEISQKVVTNRHFRHALLEALVGMYSDLAEPDYLSMCQCLLFLDDHIRVAKVLSKLVCSDKQHDFLYALQIAFDLTQNQYNSFMHRVIQELPSPEASMTEEEKKLVTSMYERTADDHNNKQEEKESNVNAMDTTADDTTTTTITATETAPDNDGTRMIKLKKILSSEVPANLYLKFLYQYNNSDKNILRKIKNGLVQKNSVTHNATVMANAMMQAGTTNDNFVANNQKWLMDNFKDWAKFMVTASIGVIHKGYTSQSMNILDLYLPKEGQTDVSHSHGGALFALGLINTNDVSKAEYLLNAIRTYPTQEPILHGACLGIGLTSMATQNMLYYEELKVIAFGDSAVGGEAAAIAIGLIMLGSANETVVEELLTYAHDSHDNQHEKITRGIAMAIAMIYYGQEENADNTIDQMSNDKDPIVRYGAMYTIGMAFAGTANNSAIRRLLHVAVSDVNDDVRRGAVTCLGFVLCNSPHEVPKIVSLLSESYNQHVRYGACMAVGIACAGSGDMNALRILEPLLRDRIDYVRQAAFIATGMVLMQQNEIAEPKVKRFIKTISSILEKPSDTMTKLGAILAVGIMNAGGRNVCISLRSPSGFNKMEAIVGMMMFQQFWYWHPFSYFIALSFSPTAVIGLNANLQMPESFSIISNAPPSKYAYPEEMSLEVVKVQAKLKKATLSVSDKVLKRKKAKAEGIDMKDAMVDDDTTKNTTEEEKEEDGTTTTTETKIIEPEFETLTSPCRVTSAQMKTVTLPTVNQRYHPIKDINHVSGFVMLIDSTPNEKEKIVVPSAPGFCQHAGISRDEPEPPQPFPIPERFLTTEE